mmetsp:Transcript_97451/g.284570  ORF Transcript_97451/g.284570 Transcript_97451/m.284570 type:complete len:448 (-) Transcript_97451:47-1390(-)
MAAAIDDVERGNGQDKLVSWLTRYLCDVLIQCHLVGCRTSAANCHGNRQDGIGTQLRLAPAPLVLGAVKLFHHELINLVLLPNIHANELGSDDVVHVGDGLEHAFAQQPPLVAVAELERLVDAGRRAAGDRRPELVRRRAQVHLHGRVAPGVEDLAGADALDLRLRRDAAGWSRRHLGLVLHGLGRCLDLLGIAEVAAVLQRRHRRVAREGLEVRVQAVDEGRARGDLEACDDVVGDVLDVLQDRADRVPVRRHKDGLPCLQRWRNLGLPEGHDPRNRVLQALGYRDLLLFEVHVLWVLAWVELTVLLDRRGWDVEAPAPNLDLVGAVFLDCLLLVKACEASIHALVQAPGLLDWQVHLVRLLQSVVQRLDGALEDRGVADVKLKALVLDERSCVLGLPDALLGEVDVDPAGEAVVHVPLRLAVAREDEQGVRLLRHGWSLGSRALR